MNDTKPLIVIVDDDSDTRTIVSGTLSILDVHTIECESGEAALNLLRETLPDVLVLDVMMPGISGFEVCEDFKKLPGAELVPVIMLTARDNVKDIVSGLDGGADDYLTKPFHYEELQARVRALLRVRQLNLDLQKKNKELQAMQEKLILQERQALLGQFAGTAAHELGQPLSAILLNCHLIEKQEEIAEQAKNALLAIKNDAHRMKKIVEQIRNADTEKLSEYYGEQKILEI